MSETAHDPRPQTHGDALLCADTLVGAKSKPSRRIHYGMRTELGNQVASLGIDAEQRTRLRAWRCGGQAVRANRVRQVVLAFLLPALLAAWWWLTASRAVTPALIAQGMTYAVGMGLVGATWPAWGAARLPIVTALRDA
jgi:hypothetical protein